MGILFWLWAFNTNSKLTKSNDLQEQNNRLLEQIRRNSLTPAERADEDAAHARKAALQAAEEKLQEERKWRILGWTFVIVVIAVVATATYWHTAQERTTTTYAGQAASYTVVEATPTPAAQPEARVRVIPPPPIARRAELVRRTHHRYFADDNAPEIHAANRSSE
jgi:hypothetical protein